MTRVSRTPIWALTLLASGLLFISAAYAQGPGPGKGPAWSDKDGPPRERWLDRLDLTDVQKAKIKGIREEGREAMKAKHEAMKAAHEALSAKLQEGANKATLEKLHEKVIRAKDELERARFANMLKIREVLTPEQRKKMAEHHPWKRGRKGRRWRDRDR